MSKIKKTNSTYSDLIKSLVTGVILLFVGGYSIYSLLERTFNEYVLMRFGETTSGYITAITEDANETDARGIVFVVYYAYEFKLPNGRVVKASDSEDGRIPHYLSNVEEEPYKMEVVYMKNDPQISKIKTALSYNSSAAFKRGILSIIIMLVTLYCSFLVIKPRIKQFLLEKDHLNKL